MVDAGLEVMCVNPAGKLDFLDLDDLLLFLCFLLTLVALKAVFAVVHDAAYRRLCLRGNQHKIHALLIGDLARLIRLQNTDLLTVRTDHADFLYPDIVVDLRRILCANS